MPSSSRKGQRKQTRQSASFVQRDASPTNSLNLSEALSPKHLERSARRCSDGSFGLRLEECLNDESFDIVPKTDYTYVRSGSYDRKYIDRSYISPNMSRRRLRAGADATGTSILLDPADSDSSLSESWLAQSSSSAAQQSSRTTTATVTTTRSSLDEQSESMAAAGRASLQNARRRTTSALPDHIPEVTTANMAARRRTGTGNHYYKGMVLRSGLRLKGLTAEERQRAIAAGLLPPDYLSVPGDFNSNATTSSLLTRRDLQTSSDLISSSAGQSQLQADSAAQGGAEWNHDGSYIVKTVTEEEWFYDDEHDGDMVGVRGSGRRSRKDKFLQTQDGLLRRSARKGVVRRDLSEDFEVEKGEEEEMEKGAMDATQNEVGAYGSAYKTQVNNSYTNMYQTTEHDYGRDADVSDVEYDDYTLIKQREHRKNWFYSVWTTITETIWETSLSQKVSAVTYPVRAGGWWLWSLLAAGVSAIRSAGQRLWRLVTQATYLLVAALWWLGNGVSTATKAVQTGCGRLWEKIVGTGETESSESAASQSTRVTRSRSARKKGSRAEQISESSSAASESGAAEASFAEISESAFEEMAAVSAADKFGSGSAYVDESEAGAAWMAGWGLGDAVAMVTSPVKRGGWWMWEWMRYLSANLLLLDVYLLERSRRRGLCCCLCLPLLLLLPLLGWLFLTSPTGQNIYSMYQSSDGYLLAGFLPKSSSSEDSWFFSQWKEAPTPEKQESAGAMGVGVGTDRGGGDTKVVYTGLGREEVQRIVDETLARNMGSVRSEFLALLKEDQDSRVQAQNSLQIKLEAFHTAITAMNEKSENLAAQISGIKAETSEQTEDQKVAAAASVKEMEARLLALQQEMAALREEQAVAAAQLAALRGETTDLKAGLAAFAAMARNCCQNETALAAAIRSQVMGVLTEITQGGGGEGGEDGSRAGFLAWLGQHYISKADYETELAKFADEITRKLALLAKEQAALGETLAASASVHREADAVATGVVPINEDYIRLLVDEALAKFNADKTGMADYALESAGGSIVSTRCSETYYRKTALVSIFGIPLWYTSNSPRTVIQPEVHPGQCWAFAGAQGTLVVELAVPIKPTGFSLEHIPKSLSPTGNINSAPEHFTVLGLASEADTIGKILGNYTYSDEGKPIQFFPVQVDDVHPYRYIELRITSNHGNLEYTCLYRFRVHGVPHEED